MFVPRPDLHGAVDGGEDLGRVVGERGGAVGTVEAAEGGGGVGGEGGHDGWNWMLMLVVFLYVNSKLES